jgi:hypothetical protein
MLLPNALSGTLGLPPLFSVVTPKRAVFNHIYLVRWDSIPPILPVVAQKGNFLILLSFSPDRTLYPLFYAISTSKPQLVHPEDGSSTVL